MAPETEEGRQDRGKRQAARGYWWREDNLVLTALVVLCALATALLAFIL